MAVADTYNGDLVRIYQKCPEAGADFDTELTECQEQAYAYINMKLDSADAAVPVTGADKDNMLKTIEAMIGGGLFKEMQIFPADDKEWGPKKALMRKTGEEWLEEWIANKYGSTGDEAGTFSIHQKVSRPAHIAASEFNDDRDVI